MQALLEIVWAVAIQPLVMGLAGASIHFATLPSGVALKALALAAIGEHYKHSFWTLLISRTVNQIALYLGQSGDESHTSTGLSVQTIFRMARMFA